MARTLGLVLAAVLAAGSVYSQSLSAPEPLAPPASEAESAVAPTPAAPVAGLEPAPALDAVPDPVPGIEFKNSMPGTALAAPTRAVEEFRSLPGDASAADVYSAGRELELSLAGRSLAAAPAEAPEPQTGGTVVLYAPYGAGHEMAAKAVVKAYENRGIRAEAVNILSFAPAWQARLSLWVNTKLMTRWTKFYDMGYTLTDKLLSKPWIARIWRRVEPIMLGRVIRALEARKPDTIVATYMLSESLNRFKQKTGFAGRIGVVITDRRIHATWIGAKADRYYVAGGTDAPGAAPSTELAEELARRGVPRERILATGLPVQPGIDKVRPDTVWSKPSVLIMGGGYGFGPLERVTRAFEGAKDVHLEIVAGRNPEIQAKLEALVKQLGLDATVHGFVPHDELLSKMAGVSLVVTKPGGVTTTEAEALGKPMVLLGPAIGQEVGNARDVRENGAGQVADEPEKAARMTLALLRHPKALAVMSRRARALANTRAADDIVDDMLRP